MAHWVWGAGGWITNLGALDFAGGTVVHIISGISALCCVLVMGRRQGLRQRGHATRITSPMTVIGTGLLWFGWFGFNAGSALAAGSLGRRRLRQHEHRRRRRDGELGSLIEWLHKGKATVLGACSGAVAGLVAVTPAAGFVTPMGAMAIGCSSAGCSASRPAS